MVRTPKKNTIQHRIQPTICFGSPIVTTRRFIPIRSNWLRAPCRLCRGVRVLIGFRFTDDLWTVRGCVRFSIGLRREVTVGVCRRIGEQNKIHRYHLFFCDALYCSSLEHRTCWLRGSRVRELHWCIELPCSMLYQTAWTRCVATRWTMGRYIRQSCPADPRTICQGTDTTVLWITYYQH